MLELLSDDWVAALDRALQDPALGAATADVGLIVEQEVTGGPTGTRTFHLRFDHGQLSAAPGPAPSADLPLVRFAQDHATARAIAAGTSSAQRAFMAGDLQVGGDLRILLEHQPVLAALGDVFAVVRADTDLADSAADPAPTAGSEA